MNSTFNPWVALRSAKAKNAELVKFLHEMTGNAKEVLQSTQELALRLKLAEAHIDRLNEKLKEAHFRNPKTGRIGRKGERF